MCVSLAVGALKESAILFLEAATDITVKLISEAGQDLTADYVTDMNWTGRSTRSLPEEGNVESDSGFHSFIVLLLGLALLVILALVVVISVLAYFHYSLRQKYNSSLAEKTLLDAEMQEYKDEERDHQGEMNINDVASLTSPTQRLSATGSEEPSLFLNSKEEVSSSASDEHHNRDAENASLHQHQIQELVEDANAETNIEDTNASIHNQEKKKKKKKKKKYIQATNGDAEEEEGKTHVSDKNNEKEETEFKPKMKQKKKNTSTTNKPTDRDAEEEANVKNGGISELPTLIPEQSNANENNENNNNQEEEDEQPTSQTKERKWKRKHKKKHLRTSEIADDTED